MLIILFVFVTIDAAITNFTITDDCQEDVYLFIIELNPPPEFDAVEFQEISVQRTNTNNLSLCYMLLLLC